MPAAPTRKPISVSWLVLWLATLALTIAVYWPGLDGDFLFDDNPHIVRNGLVQIDSLTPSELWQAWSSSVFSFPNSRPLAMLTFGINHAFSGLNPFAFKATNLALHLLAGLLLYIVARRLAGLFLRLEGRADADGARWWAWLTAALWLFHPLNLSPVLLSVQRMTILATLAVLLGMLCYLVGRRRLVDGERGGLALIVASPFFAGLGLLGKESALLLPVLLFVTEWTLLRFRGLDDRPRRALKVFFWAVAALPVALAAIYLATHPGHLSYTTRPFNLEERVLTEARILWFYVRMLLLPDVSAMGLFHDDIVISRSLFEPWTTLPAVLALAAAALGAVLVRKRLPLLSFAVLFFLVGHSMESSVIGLELVYEHRNHVPGIAVLFAVAYLPTAGAAALPVSRSLLAVLVGAVLVALAGKTAMRAYDWSGFGRLISSEVEHHPNSLRANFQYAQLLMEQIKNAELSTEAAALAKQHFEHMAALNANHADGLFGLVVLELYQGRAPPQALIDRLAERLRRIPWGPLTVSTGQFAYLAKWHDTTEPVARLSREQMLQLFEAALANPTLPPIGRGAVYHALRGYYQRVLRELEPALEYADLAIRAMPNEWDLHDRRIRLLAMLGRFDEAEKALQTAVETDKLGIRGRDAAELAQTIAGARRGEPVPFLPAERNHRLDGATR